MGLIILLIFYLQNEVKWSFNVLPSFFALLVGIVLKFDNLVEVVSTTLLFDVLLDKLREPQLTYLQ
jgi:hypothetical protein